MEITGTIAAIIAAVFTIIGYRFTVRNSKGYIIKQIEKKEEQIYQIEHQLVLKYGLNGRGISPLTELDFKKRETTTRNC